MPPKRYHRGPTASVHDAASISRLYLLTLPNRPQPWASPQWWLARAAELPEKGCGKQPQHGPATVDFSITALGRTLAYHCVLCGWMQTVLIQDGAGAPQEPSPATALVRRPTRMTRAQKGLD